MYNDQDYENTYSEQNSSENTQNKYSANGSSQDNSNNYSYGYTNNSNESINKLSDSAEPTQNNTYDGSADSLQNNRYADNTTDNGYYNFAHTTQNTYYGSNGSTQNTNYYNTTGTTGNTYYGTTDNAQNNGYYGAANNAQNNSYYGTTGNVQNTGYYSSSGNTQNSSYYGTTDDIQSNNYGTSVNTPQANSYTESSSNDNASYTYAKTSASHKQPTPHHTPRKQKKQRSGFGAKVVAIALICALLGGLSGAGCAYLVLNTVTQSSTTAQSGTTSTILTGSRESSTIVLSEIDTGSQLTAAEVYAQNVNSTVGITTTITTNYFGYETTSAASGSGFIITSDGYIVTNYHVIEDYSSVTVSLYDGTTYVATVVGYDENNDLAVLKIDADELTPVVLGDSDNMNIGDSVIAIGNPLGELTFSLTQGVVSAMNRSVTMSSGVTMTLLQTDCAINSGNSGGPLFNLYGEVIGITNAKYSSSSSSSEASIDNIGFAIPINSVKSTITSIIETGTIQSSYIGVTITDMTMSAAASSGVTSGAVVYSVTEGAPADEAGIQVGDVITSVNGTAITGSSDLKAIVTAASGGDELVCTVHRSGEILEITIIVGTQYTSALPESTTTESSESDSSSSASGSSGSSSSGSSSSGSSSSGSSSSGSSSSGSRGRTHGSSGSGSSGSGSSGSHGSSGSNSSDSSEDGNA